MFSLAVALLARIMLENVHMHIYSIVALSFACLVGCGDLATTSGNFDDDPVTNAEAANFGLPGKGDQLCERRSALCWSTSDALAMRNFFAADDAFRLALTEPQPLFEALMDAALGLAAKLTDEERRSLQIVPRPSSVMLEDVSYRTALAERLSMQILERLIGGYLTAFAVPMGQLAANSVVGKQDSLPMEAFEVVSMVLGDLGLHGPFHGYMAMMLHTTGALEPLPAPFTEDFPYALPLEIRAKKLTDAYTAASAAQSAVSQAITFIPVAGVALAVPYGLTVQFRLRARMILALAALHGSEPRAEDGVQLIVAVIGAATEAPEASESVMEAIDGHRRHDLNDDSLTLAHREHTRELIGLALGRIGVSSAKILSHIKLRAAAKAGRSTILGYATLGLASIAELILEGVVTSRIGWRAKVLTRPWAQESLRARAQFLRDQTLADCLHRTMGHLAGPVPSDGALAFITGHLDRQIYIDHRWVPAFSDELKEIAAAHIINGAKTNGLPSCIDHTFDHLSDESLLHLMSWLEVITHLSPEAHRQDGSEKHEITLRVAKGWMVGAGAHPAAVMGQQVKLALHEHSDVELVSKDAANHDAGAAAWAQGFASELP